MKSRISRRAGRIVAITSALAAALFLSSCTSTSSSDGHTEPSHAEQATPLITEQPAAFNADDVAFVTDMIPHHQQAVALSALVPQRSTNAQVIALANAIAAAQEPEINTMKALQVQWKENPDSNTGHSGHGGMAMDGMVDEAAMAKLESLRGAEFDTLWLQSMTGHHQGAIAMAKAEIANGANVDAKQLAQDIVTAQQAEIEQMQQMLRNA